jgi:hypothetical protein
MVAPKIYHPFRKWAVRNIIIGSALGIVAAEGFWHFVVVPKVERRNFVMKLIEDERLEKKAALQQAVSELAGQGSFSDLVKE